MLDELRGSNEFICAPAIKFPLLFLMNFTFDSVFEKVARLFFKAFCSSFYIIRVKIRTFPREIEFLVRHFLLGDKEICLSVSGMAEAGIIRHFLGSKVGIGEEENFPSREGMLLILRWSKS